MSRTLGPLVLLSGVLCATTLAAQTAESFDPLARPTTLEGSSASLDDVRTDGHRTLGHFAANFGHNLVGVVSQDNLRPFLIGASVAGAGAFFDSSTERYFAGQHRADSLGNLGASLGSASSLVPFEGALFLAGRLSHNERFRAATYDMAQASLVNLTWTSALKLATQRERPNGANRLSFPSGHASDAFAWATVAGHYYGPKVGVPAFALAGLIGVSRLEVNAHHLSDVLAGAALGYISGRTVVRGDDEPTSRSRRIFLTPVSGPSGTGIGLALAGHF